MSETTGAPTPTPTNEQQDARFVDFVFSVSSQPPDDAWDEVADLIGHWAEQHGLDVLGIASHAADDDGETFRTVKDALDAARAEVAALREQYRDLATYRTTHTNLGLCPEGPDDPARDPDCPVCAALGAAAPDERGLPGVWETWQRPGAHPSVASEYAAMEAGWTAALAARPAPAVNAADVEITTAAELDALPAGTIVRDRFGGYLAQGRDAMGVAWFHYPDYDHAGSSALVAGIGPVTVCFTPGLTVADEGRA